MFGQPAERSFRRTAIIIREARSRSAKNLRCRAAGVIISESHDRSSRWRATLLSDPLMETTTNQQVLHHRGNYLVRRQRLRPGEATPWHRDPFHRVTVVLKGDVLNIEFRDGGETQQWKVTVGEVDWIEPSDRVHRAVNVGKEVFEEVVTFFLDRPDAEPQLEDNGQ